MPSFELRPFDEPDRPAVIALWTAVFGYAAPHNDPAFIIDRKLAFQRELFLVAVSDGESTGGEIVGTVLGGYDGHRGWIYSLAVRPAARRQGIATALVRRMEAMLQSLGCFKINLQVVASNAAVVAFYQQLGYALEDRLSLGKLI
jgi:ribosomal protein S18 acetylase RimI-like enzyme